MEYRFDGAIAGVGTGSGTRLVVGIWPGSPFGPFADVMAERADGERLLLAPTGTVAEFVAATYRFDTVRVAPLTLRAEGPSWHLESASLRLTFTTGRRTALGHLLSAIPRPLARSKGWCRAIDPAARLLRPGVRTAGTAGSGRREYYCALDEHAVVAAGGQLDGADLGELRPLAPPVRFGFGSAPPRPALVRVTTLVDV